MSDFKKFCLYALALGLVVVGCLYLIGNKATEFAHDTVINVAPETVFEWLTKPEKRAQWVSELKSSRVAEPLGEHSIYESVFDVDGKSIETPENVVLFKSNEVITIRRKIKGINITNVFKLKALEKSTHLSYSVDEKRDALPSIIFFLDKRDVNRRSESELSKLKQLIESSLPKSNATAKESDSKQVESDAPTKTDKDDQNPKIQ